MNYTIFALPFRRFLWSFYMLIIHGWLNVSVTDRMAFSSQYIILANTLRHDSNTRCYVRTDHLASCY